MIIYYDKLINMLKDGVSLDYCYLLSFLLNYDILSKYDGDLVKLLKAISVNKQLPTNLLMTKFFEYIVFKKIEIEFVYGMLNVGDEIEAKNSVKQFIDLIESKITNSDLISFKEFDRSICWRLIENIIGDVVPVINSDEILHYGQPLPDSDLGRPHLMWCKCQHADCGKMFKKASDLVAHLVKNNVYTQGYHLEHENAVKRLDLTTEKVIEEKMFRCPSTMCNFISENPQQLIDHFQQLGIEPFWKVGMKIEPQTSLICGMDLIHKAPKIFASNNCVICMDEVAQILINNCGHHVYCLGCFKICDKNRCPICRNKVDKFWPYC